MSGSLKKKKRQAEYKAQNGKVEWCDMLNKELLEKVVNLAREAGKMVLNRENTKIIEKDGVANFVTPTDIAISNFLSEELRLPR